MPKAEPHFDAIALLTAVAQQDVGLRVTTNSPDAFRRILYGAMRANPPLRCYCYSDPRTRNSFLLVTRPIPQLSLPEEPVDA